ncbi:MAG: hypothetical protein R3F48_02525 [Candidatus Zixiibacteriota bacterium]
MRISVGVFNGCPINDCYIAGSFREVWGPIEYPNGAREIMFAVNVLADSSLKGKPLLDMIQVTSGEITLYPDSERIELSGRLYQDTVVLSISCECESYLHLASYAFGPYYTFTSLPDSVQFDFELTIRYPDVSSEPMKQDHTLILRRRHFSGKYDDYIALRRSEYRAVQEQWPVCE